MLAYSLRALRIGLAEKFKPTTTAFEPIVQTYRAWPWYCDQNLHINNAQYLTFMDYGRVSWLVRSGLIGSFLGVENQALVAGLGMTYRREIRWFSAFELETQAVAVEGRWLYVVQTFRQEGKVCARGVVRVAVRGRDGLQDLEEMFGDAAPRPDDGLRMFIEGADAQVRATSVD